jgi:Tol biopolymer transport system component
MARTSARRPRLRDPYGLLPDRSWLAPGLSLAGLALVGAVTLSLLGGSVPFVGGSKGGIGGGGAGRTAAPSNVVLVPEVSFPGSIVYAKAGNIWVQHGREVHQLTTGGTDSMPSWSPDGASVYFIRTRDALGLWPAQGVERHYQETVPSIMRVAAAGGEPERILDGAISSNGRSWFSWIRQPVLSPDGTTVAMVSDGPDPTRSDVVLQFYDQATNQRTIPQVSESAPLGHQDPTWRDDGKFLLYVRNGREGARGAPEIFRWDVARKKAAQLTGPGYLEPSYSPNGLYIAATRTSSFGNDVVILDAAHGRELLRVTADGASWAPVWSPAGDAIAFLHIEGQIVDLRLAKLGGAGPAWTVADTIDLTQVSGLDGGSRPGWYIPANELPATPSPSGSPSGGSSAASGGSASP